MIDGTEITGTPPTQILRLPSGGYVIGWHRQDFDMELLVCRAIVSLPSDGQMTDCWAGMWRLKAHAPLNSSTFTAVWEKGYTWTDGGPNSGQYQYTKTWDDGEMEVSIGTGDEDALASRAQRGDGLPTEWEPHFRSTHNHFDWFSLQPIYYEIGDAGLAIPLPPLKTGQQCQVDFVVAWSPERDDDSTGLVERSTAEILAGAGCS